jgi:hypothetical protein
MTHLAQSRWATYWQKVPPITQTVKLEKLLIMAPNTFPSRSIFESASYEDLNFEDHLKLLSLDINCSSNDQEARFEELRTTPLFSGLVKAYANTISSTSNSSSSDSLTSYAPPILPQYGLLAGTLQEFGSSDDHDEAPDKPNDPRIFLNVNSPWSAFICGSQGSGKSHTLSCILENCLQESSLLGRLPRPLAGIIFHYDTFTAVASGQICEAAYLCSSGIPVRVLVSPSNYHTMKRLYSKLPGLSGGSKRPEVVPLLLKEKHLNIERMMMLMAVSDGNGPLPLYLEVSFQHCITYHKNLTPFREGYSEDPPRHGTRK